MHIDALTLLLVHRRRGRGVGGFYPEIPLQHTSSFCETFSTLSRYVCMNVSSSQNVGNVVVTTKSTCHFTLHQAFEILTCTMSGPLDFRIFWGGGHAPRPPRGSHLRRSYLITPLNKYFCQYEHPSKNLSYGPGSTSRY